MPEYLAPGVFLEEVELKAPSIEGVSTSTTGMVGFTTRGQTVGRPVLVTNPLQFRQTFGGPLPETFAATNELFYAAQGFFANGGRRLYVTRVTGAGAVTALAATQGGFVTRLAPGADAVVGQPVFRPASLRGLTDGMQVRLEMVRDGVIYTSSLLNINASGINGATGEVTLAANIDISPAGPASFSARSTAVISRIININAAGTPTVGAARPASLVIEAADSGAWGGNVVLQAAHVTAASAELDTFIAGANNNNQIRLRSTAGFYVNAWVEIDRGSTATKTFRRVLAVNGTVLTLAGPALNAAAVAPSAPATTTIFSVCEFSLTASYDGATETYRGLTLEQVPGKYVVDQVNNRSNLIRIDTTALPAATNPFFFPSGDDGLNLAFTTAGTDVAPVAADVRGVDNGPGNRTGLRALEEIDDISIIAVPGWGDQSVQEAMIEQCERLKYRVAFLDPEVTTLGVPPTLIEIQNQRRRFDTKYAAVYYPRIVVRDATDQPKAIGASGHMAGICARVDNSRGVFKAPGNEVVRNILDLEVIVTKGEHEVLNPSPNNINVFRDFRNEGRGLRIYGARCITSLNDWKYLSVRRLFIFIERSLEIGTQYAVLEPNDQRLWAKLIDSVDIFLTRLWRDGALLGDKKEHAFYVRCGLDTMTQDDIDNGRLIMEIGIAPVKPAEFVIIRIGQSASGSFTQEI
jgi:phage tail sheath protein FI